MPRRNFNNDAYRARAARAQRQHALQQAQRRLIQQLRRNRQIPRGIQEAILLEGNRTVQRAQAGYITPQIAIPIQHLAQQGEVVIATLLTQQEIPIAQRVIDPRQAHDRYMRALGLNPNYRPSN